MKMIIRRYEGTGVRRYEGTKVRGYEGTRVRRCVGALAAALMMLSAAPACAQTEETDTVQLHFVKSNDVHLDVQDPRKLLDKDDVPSLDKNMLNHLDVALTLGTTGVGIDLAMPVGDYVRVRAGYAFMPSVKHTMNFGLSIAEEDPKYDKQGNRIETKFEKLSKLFEQITGREVGTSVDMIGRPVYNNVKLLVDVFPFRNKKWFFTGGFYYGSTDIARTCNRQEDIAALYSVDMYNRLYDKVMTAYDDPWNPFNDVLLFEHNGIPYYIPTEMADLMHTYMSRYGKMGVHLGDYFLVPDENCMVKATVKANRFKPYLGFGYGNATPKGDKKYGFMLEAGLMFWGGSPEVDCYGTDLVKMNVKGKVGDYVSFFESLTVFPVINLRISRRLF